MHVTGIAGCIRRCRDVGRLSRADPGGKKKKKSKSLKETATNDDDDDEDDDYEDAEAAESDKKAQCRYIIPSYSPFNHFLRSHSPPMALGNKLFEYFLLRAVIRGGSVSSPCHAVRKEAKGNQTVLVILQALIELAADEALRDKQKGTGR